MKRWKWNRISRLESYLCWRRLRKEEAKYLRYLLRLLAESKREGKAPLKAPASTNAYSGSTDNRSDKFPSIFTFNFLAFSGDLRGGEKYDHWIDAHLSWSYFLAFECESKQSKGKYFQTSHTGRAVSCLITSMRWVFIVESDVQINFVFNFIYWYYCSLQFETSSFSQIVLESTTAIGIRKRRKKSLIAREINSMRYLDREPLPSLELRKRRQRALTRLGLLF